MNSVQDADPKDSASGCTVQRSPGTLQSVQEGSEDSTAAAFSVDFPLCRQSLKII